MTRAGLWLAGFVAIVVAANLATAQWGLVTWLGVTATAGTWLAGLAFVARDGVQDTGGRKLVLVAIGAGAVLSAAFSPRLAVASGVAFLISELADFGVYSPLRLRHRWTARLVSNTVGAVVDSAAFLLLAGFPLVALPGQVLIKVGVTASVVGVQAVLLRAPLRGEPQGAGRHG